MLGFGDPIKVERGEFGCQSSDGMKTDERLFHLGK